MNSRMLAIAAGAMLAALSVAHAESTKPPAKETSPATSQGDQDKKAEGSSQAQPQGATGSTDTSSGGAPASSPQGDAPSGMQATPHGSPALGSPVPQSPTQGGPGKR